MGTRSKDLLRMTRSFRFTFWAALVLGNYSAAQQTPAPDSVRVVIIYYSEHGHTAALAEAVAQGARQVSGVQVRMLQVAQAKIQDVLAADALILGSPVQNANVAPPLQQFINQWPFAGHPLRNKIGAAFVTAGGISAGEELVQMNILHAMMIFGMIIVGGPEWRSPFGAAAIVNEAPFVTEHEDGRVAAAFMVKGKALGQRVAEVAKRWKMAGRPD